MPLPTTKSSRCFSKMLLTIEYPAGLPVSAAEPAITLPYLAYGLEPPGVRFPEDWSDEYQGRQEQHRRRNRPGHEYGQVTLRHHQRLSQRSFHAVAEHESKYQRRRRIGEPSHYVTEQAEGR